MTEKARLYVNYLAPTWFKIFYIKHGERIAAFIKNKPRTKTALRPLFEYFAKQGEKLWAPNSQT